MEAEHEAPPDTAKKRNGRNTSKVNMQLGTGSKRYLVVPSSLESIIQQGIDDRKTLIESFNTISDYQGAMRCILSLALNYLLSRASESLQGIGKLDKSLIDRVWTALELWRNNPDKAALSKHGTVVAIGDFLRSSDMKLESLPPKCKFDLRQRTSDDIATSVRTYLAHNFAGRLRQHLNHLLANSSLTSAKEVKSVSGRIMTIIYGDAYEPSQLDGILAPTSVDPETLAILHAFVNECRELMDDIVMLASHDKEEKVPFSYAIKSHGYMCLPLMAKLSRSAQIVRERVRLIIEQSKVTSSKERGSFIRSALITQKCQKPPPVFPLVPLFKLRPCFVEYGSTEIETMFNKSISLADFQAKLLDTSKIPQLKNKSMLLHSIRTDGYSARVVLVALRSTRPPPPNTDKLVESGYNIPVPSRKVNCLTDSKGVYRVTENRYDNRKISKSDNTSSLKLVVIDPGCKSVVCVRESCFDRISTAESILETSDVWDIDSDKYRKMSGYDLQKKRDQMRRKGIHKYRDALDALRVHRNRSAQSETLIGYCTAFARHLKFLMREKCRTQRKKARWVSGVKQQRALANIADFISGGAKKTEQGKLQKVKSTEKRIIFFGDGTYRTPKKCVSVPRKSLVHQLATRSIVFVVDEYRTSKACPACLDGIMEDVSGERRMRSCSSTCLNGRAGCSFATRMINRDEVATVSQTIVAKAALSSCKRPQQFCRNPTVASRQHAESPKGKRRNCNAGV